jgi:hypothetical protein
MLKSLDADGLLRLPEPPDPQRMVVRDRAQPPVALLRVALPEVGNSPYMTACMAYRRPPE